MTIPFFKYHGTGNDFIIIDQRVYQYLTISDEKLIGQMCNRRFGIGADGLMLIQNMKGVDFEMIYFNSDGKTSSMCGNGGRCIVSLAGHLGIFSRRCTFLAIDGEHEASINELGNVSLKMNNVLRIDRDDHAFVLDTGSPHYVRFVEDLNSLDMLREGQAIRYNEPYKKKGINVNLAECQNDELSVRTYERGVEGETYSCGTGVVAAAIAQSIRLNLPSQELKIKTQGGNLSVSFERVGDVFENIWLVGPATLVYQGQYIVKP